MSFLAINPAGFSDLSWYRMEQANKSLSTCNYGGELRPSYGGHADRIELRLRRPSAASVRIRTLLWSVSAVMYPVLCSVTASGLFRRPSALGLLLRAARPFGVSVPPKTSLRTTAKYASQTSFGPLPESRPSALGSRAHSLSSAQCDPSYNGRIPQTATLSCTRTK